MNTDAVLTLLLRRSLYVGLEPIATFDVCVVGGSSALLNTIEGGVRLDVSGCTEIVWE